MKKSIKKRERKKTPADKQTQQTQQTQQNIRTVDSHLQRSSRPLPPLFFSSPLLVPLLLLRLALAPLDLDRGLVLPDHDLMVVVQASHPRTSGQASLTHPHCTRLELLAEDTEPRLHPVVVAA